MTTAPTLPLYEAAVNYARSELKHREQALKTMRRSLELLDACMPELRARHVAPHVGHIHWRAATRSLSISPTFTSESPKLLAALLAIGFKETGRQDHATFTYVDLKKGRLKVHLCVYPTKGAA